MSPSTRVTVQHQLPTWESRNRRVNPVSKEKAHTTRGPVGRWEVSGKYFCAWKEKETQAKWPHCHQP